MNIFIFIIILLVLVLVHEWGHFFSAKRFGIRVDEFGFGFPPKIFGFKKGETEYSINALPFGGFVKIFGESPDIENTTGPDSSRSFVNKPKWQQAIVLFAGVFMNFLLAWLLLSFGFMSGLPTSVSNQSNDFAIDNKDIVVVSVLEDSPAQIAGLLPGDRIISLKDKENLVDVLDVETLKSFISLHNNQEIEFNYKRGNNQDLNTIKVIPTTNSIDSIPFVGISIDQIGIVKLPFFQSLYEGMKLNLQITKSTAQGLFELIKDVVLGKGSFQNVTGPVGMVHIVGDAYKFGFAYLLSFASLISINLAIINLIPFPALDGGRLLFLLIEKIKGSPISSKIINISNIIGFGILILLMILVTYHDIIKLF